MVARLVRYLSSLVHIRRNFRVRSGKSGVRERVEIRNLVVLKSHSLSHRPS